MNDVGVYIMDDHEDDPGSVPAYIIIFIHFSIPFFVSFFFFMGKESLRYFIFNICATHNPNAINDYREMEYT